MQLGNVINGRGPIDDSEDDDDNDLGHHNMGPQFNPMMGMGANPMSFSHSAGPPGWNWQQQGQPSPGLMPPQFGSDPNYLMAHQQAMMIAKQTYQMAVAQQALAAAGDEWERNSNVSGFGGSQAFGATPGFGGPSMNMNVGMFGMGGGMGGFGSGMGMGMSHGWPNPSLMVPSAPRSAYGGAFGGAQSEYGGSPGGGSGWGSKSVYGESFGPSSGDRALKTFSATPRGQPQNRLQQQQESYFPSAKGNRERERRNESSGHSNRADGGSNSSGQQHSRSGPRPRTLTAPSSSQTPVKVRRPEPSSPPPSSFRRFNGA
jgi:serine/arginine repetitive matrix protein 2